MEGERKEKTKLSEELGRLKSKKSFAERDNKQLKLKVQQLESDLERSNRELTQFESERKLQQSRISELLEETKETPVRRKKKPTQTEIIKSGTTEEVRLVLELMSKVFTTLESTIPIYLPDP